MVLRFYKEENLWYVDLPKYIEGGGSKEDLLMVSGAPEFLEYLSDGKGEVRVDVLNNCYDLEGWLHLRRRKDIPVQSGAYYSTIDNFWVMWLCDVMLWIFGEFPENLFIKVLKNEELDTGRLGENSSSGTVPDTVGE